MFRKVLALSLLLAPATAEAKWLRAESKNFIVHGDGTEAELKAQAEKLEKFAFVLRAVSNRKIAESPVKLKIYRVYDMDDISWTVGGAEGVAAYYVPTVRGSYVVTPTKVQENNQLVSADKTRVQEILMSGDDAFYHEVTHHFMFQYFPAAYPTWYSEGFAEFYGSFQIDAKDRVTLGRPQRGRIANLQDDWLPVKKLLTGRSYADFGSGIYALYAEGWLLIHYADQNPERGGQLKKYLADINAGMSYEKAAEVFGDLDVLNRELKKYSERSTLDMRVLPFKTIDPGPVTVRDMSPAEVALWLQDARMSGGLSQADAQRFVATVRQKAAPFPNDPYALRILTEAELIAGNLDRADAAAARLLAVAPQDSLGMMFKSNIQIVRLKVAKTPAGDPKWEEARQSLLAANKAAKQEPRIHKAIYDSFMAEGVLPPAYAQQSLAYAFKVAPSDRDIRKELARDYEQRGLIDYAIATIRPSAVMIKAESEMTPKERADRERFKANARKDPAKYASAGEELDLENSRDVLDRLERKKAASTPAAAAPAGS